MRILLITIFVSSISSLMAGTTYFVDGHATGSNNGSSRANAFTNIYNINGIERPGDTILIAGGSRYKPNTNYDGYEFHWGSNGAPVYIKYDQGSTNWPNQAFIEIPLYLQAYNHIDGSIVNNWETNLTVDGSIPTDAFEGQTNYTVVSRVEGITNNLGFVIDGTSNWFQNVLTVEGYRTDPPVWATSQNIYSNRIAWCQFAGAYLGPGRDPHGPPNIVNLDCISGPNILVARGLVVAFNCFSNVIEHQVSCGNNDVALFSGVKIHHNFGVFGQNRSTGTMYGGGVGAMIWNNILNKYPQVFGGEQEDLQLGSYWHVCNNIFYTAGAATIQCFLDNGSNYNNCFFYGNAVVPNPTNWTIYPTLGATYVQMNTEPSSTNECVKDIFINGWRFFCNSAICRSNGPAAVTAFLSKGWLSSVNTNSCNLAAAQATNLLNMRPVTAGVLFLDNMDWSPNGTNGSAFSPDYTAFNSESATKCNGGLCGFGKYNGWTYSTNDVIVNYNILGGTLYVSNNIYTMTFTVDSFALYTGFTHNSSVMPSIANIDLEDYRPRSATAGLDLSAFATNMPNLLIDLNGVPRGSVSGSWTIGALEPGDTALITNGLVLYYTMEDNFDVTNYIRDWSGHNTDAMQFGFPGTNSWPNRTNVNDNTKFAHAADFPTNIISIVNYGDFVGYQFDRHAAVTNTGPLTNLTAMTVIVWAKYYNAPGNVAANHAQSCFLDTGWHVPGDWQFGRDGNVSENTCFMIRTNQAECSPCGPNVRYPDSTVTGGTSWHWYGAVVDLTNHTLTAYFDGTNYMSITVGDNVTTVNCIQEFSKALSVGVQTHDGTPSMDKWPENGNLVNPPGGDDYPNDAWFQGQMGPVLIYNRALASNEMSFIYNGVISGGGGPSTNTCTVTTTNTTPFVVTYDTSMTVSFQAESTFSGNNFSKWTLDGSDYSTNTTISVPLNIDHTLGVVYASNTSTNHGVRMRGKMKITGPITIH